MLWPFVGIFEFYVAIFELHLDRGVCWFLTNCTPFCVRSPSVDTFYMSQYDQETPAQLAGVLMLYWKIFGEIGHLRPFLILYLCNMLLGSPLWMALTFFLIIEDYVNDSFHSALATVSDIFFYGSLIPSST